MIKPLFLVIFLISEIKSTTVFPENLLKEACQDGVFNMTKRTRSLIKTVLESPIYRPCNGTEHSIVSRFAKLEKVDE